MRITSVTISLTPPSDGQRGRLLGSAAVEIDFGLVIHDVKIIEGRAGKIIAFPNRKLMDHCPGCHDKNHCRACYCNRCGKRLADNRHQVEPDGRPKLYADMVHPINTETRDLFYLAVMAAYHAEVEASKLPGYKLSEAV